jgi:hypothetical protein
MSVLSRRPWLTVRAALVSFRRSCGAQQPLAAQSHHSDLECSELAWAQSIGVGAVKLVKEVRDEGV